MKQYDKYGYELVRKDEVVGILNKSIRRLHKEKSVASGFDYFRNISLVDMKIEIVEDIKKQVKEIEGDEN